MSVTPDPITSDTPPDAEERGRREAEAEAWMAKMREARAQDERERPARQTRSGLDDLARLREICMNCADRIERKSTGLLMMREEDAMQAIADIPLALGRLARAVRQLYVLEQETLGNRPVPGVRAPAAPTAAEKPVKPDQTKPGRPAPGPAPEPVDRNDLRDPNDYNLPLGQMLSGIFKTVEEFEPEALASIDQARLVAVLQQAFSSPDTAPADVARLRKLAQQVERLRGNPPVKAPPPTESKPRIKGREPP